MVLPKSLLKFYPVVRALGHECVHSLNDAKRLAKTVLFLWQKSAYPELALRAPYGSNQFIDLERVKNFVRWLDSQPFNDAAYWLASAYANWVGNEVRTQQALYFTPPKLADRVIDDLISRGASLATHHWHDPACGGAAFLVPIARRMAAELTSKGFPAKAVLKHIETHISGNDLDDTLLEISEQFLLMALQDLSRQTSYTPHFKLAKGDGLLAVHNPASAPDVVACNPPYRKLNATETKKYQVQFDDVIRNQPNIYGLFIRKTLDIVKPGGLVGLLTPTSFLSGASFSRLRQVVAGRTHIAQIDVLGDSSTTFISVAQQTAITVLKTNRQSQGPASADVFVLSADGTFAEVGKCVIPPNGESWPIPRTTEDVDLLARAKQWPSRLIDYGYVPRVGHLVAYRDERPRFDSRPNRKDQSCIFPIVWAGDIAPSGFVHGRQHKLERTDYFVEVPDPKHGSVISAPAVLLQRLTSNDQPHRLIACDVPDKWQRHEGGFVAENHVITLIAKQDSQWSPKQIASLMNSVVVNRLYRAISGATNVAVSEMAQLPLPDPVALRAALATEIDIEKAIRKAYGLSD